MVSSPIRWLSISLEENPSFLSIIKKLHLFTAASAFVSNFRTHYALGAKSSTHPPSYSSGITGLCTPMCLYKITRNINVVAPSLREQEGVAIRTTGVLRSHWAGREVNGQKLEVCFLLTSNRLDLISGILLECRLV